MTNMCFNRLELERHLRNVRQRPTMGAAALRPRQTLDVVIRNDNLYLARRACKQSADTSTHTKQ